ncbi:MAG: alpha/beta hydrolase [Christensenellaceae bacterium]|jgi:pimeloyl-ACP methyl ester carboxylesterase|nr:alpha/beta hydrolase [Christensenellaceae bacterium]
MLKEIFYGNYKVFYKVVGSENAPILVCLHGWGGGLNSFASLEPFLSPKYKLIIPELPCFQKTDTREPNFAYSLTDYANIVADILKNEGVSNFKNDGAHDDANVSNYSILAHSFGARVAVQPELTATSYIITGGAGLPPKFNFKTYLKIKLHKFFKIGRGSRDWQNLTPNGKQTFNNIRVDLTENYKSIDKPTLLIWGAGDNETPLYMGKAINSLIKTSSLTVYEGAKHFCFIDEPMRFANDVLLFLKAWHRV